MPFLALYANVIVFFILIWLLAGLILLLHRLSDRIGLLPLLIVLGGLTALAHLRSLPPYNITGLYLVLPALFLGVLLIYIVNGTTQARASFVGVITAALLFDLFQFLPTGDAAGLVLPEGSLLRYRLGAVLVLPLDLFGLVILYQIISNMRARFPSRLAATLAFWFILIMDAVLFVLLSVVGSTGWEEVLLRHLSGAVTAGVALWLPLSWYLFWTARQLPGTMASLERPALDIFTTALQLEARERHQASLLRTLNQVNRLIAQADDPDQLLQQTCDLLILNRGYELVWIGAFQLSGASIELLAAAGARGGQWNHFLQKLVTNDLPHSQEPGTGEPFLYRNLSRLPENIPWKTDALQQGYRSMLVLSMPGFLADRRVLHIYSAQVDAFDPVEVELLQELSNDLAQAIQRNEASRQQAILRAGFESMTGCLLVTDMEGNIQYANPATSRLVRQPLDVLVGHNLRDLRASMQIRQVIDHHFQALMDQGYFESEIEQQRENGQRIHLSLRASIVHFSGQTGYVVLLIEDITRRVQHEQRLSALNNLVTELVQIYDLRELLEAILQTSEALLQADASIVYLAGPDRKTIATYQGHNLSPGYTQRAYDDFRGLPSETAMLTRQMVPVEDVLSDSIYQERIHFMADYGIRALNALPIQFQNKSLGSLVIYYRQPHHFTEEEFLLSQTLAHTFSIVIQNTRLYQAEHNQRQFSEALAQAAAVLNTSLRLETVLQAILDQTYQVVFSRTANIMLIDGDEAYIAGQRGYSDDPQFTLSPVGMRLPLTMPTLRFMCETHQPILVSDALHDERWTVFEHTPWVRTFAGAPLLLGDEIVGFLDVNSDMPGDFDEKTLTRLQAFAAYAATAIQNARLYQQIEQYAGNLEERVRERTIALSISKERIERILASIPDAVFVLDENYEPVHINPAGEALWEQARQEQQDLFQVDWLNRLQDGTLPAEKSIQVVAGRFYQALASSLPLDHLQMGLVVVLRDVTRFQELDQMKTQFVSDVSHELRTPLTNLTLYLDLLAAVQDEERRHKYMDTLHRETGRLTHLIEDLLMISRLEAGRIAFRLREINVNEQVAFLADDRAVLASQSGLTLTRELAQGLPPGLADPQLLNQCLSNILTNALSYTPEGGNICLRTQMERQDEIVWIKIDIQDTGVGISTEEQLHVFERFYRGAASKMVESTGTGLGLAISKEIIDRMDGKITMQSSLGEGSTFSVWLRAVL